MFGDLFMVNQGVNQSRPVQSRLFNYDMPSRVQWACNAEDCGSNGTGITYVYDANSNLTQKTDARSISISYAYDPLNRLLTKTYSNDPNGTASSCYQYDGAKTSNLSGRLVSQWTQKGSCSAAPPSAGVQTKTAISAYDAMGRLTSEQRCMGIANCANNGGYPMSYTYDLAGKLLTYPSGYGSLSFANSYDAAGRHSLVTQGAGQNLLFSAPTYTPAGAVSGARLGTSITVSRTFDFRQRVLTETDSAIP